MKLTNGQKNALHEFNSGKNILLLGDPGTGKSTLISAIVENAVATGKKVVRTASTGIAAHAQRIQPIATISGTPLGASLEGFDPMPKLIPEISIRTPAIHPFLDRPANIINLTKKLICNGHCQGET